MEYRKKIDLDAETKYWFVEMGELNRLNGSGAYPFTSYEKALLFALNHKRIAKLTYGADRSVVIRFPDGTKEVIHDA